MTPKEKAEDLVDKIYYCQRYADGEDYMPLEAYKRAKQCAIITVDEIIDCTKNGLGITKFSKEYWQEVKQEIQNL